MTDAKKSKAAAVDEQPTGAVEAALGAPIGGGGDGQPEDEQFVVVNAFKHEGRLRPVDSKLTLPVAVGEHLSRIGLVRKAPRG